MKITVTVIALGSAERLAISLLPLEFTTMYTQPNVHFLAPRCKRPLAPSKVGMVKIKVYFVGTYLAILDEKTESDERNSPV